MPADLRYDEVRDLWVPVGIPAQRVVVDEKPGSPYPLTPADEDDD